MAYKDAAVKALADKTRAEDKRRVLREYLVKAGCVDCGYNKNYLALEFDHLPEFTKTRNVMALTYHSWELIWAEVAKCEVRCCNCHAIKTAERRLRIPMAEEIR